MAEKDFSHLTNDELIKGIQALKLPEYIRSKAYGVDVRETLAQMTEMTIQLGVNMWLSPDDALEWARKLQYTESRLENVIAGLNGDEEFYTPIGLESYMTTEGQEWGV